MKKLMVIAAVAFASVASHAASLTWGARNIYIPVASDLAVDETGIVAASGDKFAATALTVALYWVDGDSNRTSIGEFATTGSGTISAQTLSKSSGTAAETALYNAMLAEGATYKPSYYFTATYTAANGGVYVYTGTATATSAIGNLPSQNIAVTAKFDEAGSWSYTAAAEPEPTSGLLLMLGLAGLALKRKRA